MQAEPVSPELVLVDPELAERERARLREKARLEAIIDVAALRRAVESQTALADVPRPAVAPRHERWRDVIDLSRRRLVPAALMCSLLANGFVVARLVTRTDEASTAGVPVAVRPVTVAQASTAPATGSVPSAIRRRSRGTRATEASVERRLVSRILAAPTRKLPRAFVDPRTGLVKNNVQVVCRRATKRSFRCALRLPTSATTRELVLRYRLDRDGTGVFAWPDSRHG